MNQPIVSRARVVAASRIGGLLLMLGIATGAAAHQLRVESAQAESLLDLSRSEQKASRPVEAALALERARVLAPRSKHVREAAPARPQLFGDGLERAVSWIAPREWSSLVLGFGWLAGISMAVSLLLTRRSRPLRRIAAASAGLMLLSVAGLTESTRCARALAVVKVPTGALLAPYEGAGATADLARGVVVSETGRYAGFVRIRGPHGASGWVPAGALEAVVGS